MSGLASYAIYAIHQPLSVLVAAATPFSPSPAVAIAFLIIVTIAALVVDKTYDLPVRAWLKRLGRAGDTVPVDRRSRA
jgi:peptidoglycan/LPS O-acetylase OafA/YrhL